MSKTLNQNLLAAIAGGFASDADMKEAGLDGVREAKSASVSQYRTNAKASKKTLDPRTRSYVFSDESVDRMGDVILASGWDLTNYKENPVILWGHNSYAPPIGTASKVKTTRVNGMRSLVGDIKFADEEVNPEAELIWRMVEAGIIKTGSVGFRPSEVRYGDEITDKERNKYGIGQYGALFMQQDLLEHSLVSIPANPHAVELGLKDLVGKGIISDARAATFLEVYPQDEEAAMERARASVHSFIDMAKNISAVDDEDADTEASPESIERGITASSSDSETMSDSGQCLETDDASTLTLSADSQDVEPQALPIPEPQAAVVADDHIERHTDALTKLTLALAGLLEAQGEHVHAMRQLTDQVHDLARRGVSDSAEPTAPVEPVDSDGAGVDASEELDVSRAIKALDNLSRSLGGNL